MIRNVARKAVVLAAATLCVGALAVNCSHFKDNGGTPESNVGSVGLALTLPGGGIVSTVHYSVKNSSNVEIKAADISVTGAGSTVSVVIGGVASGTGYTVVLSATASDGTSCLGTSAPFNVVANASTSVNVLLLCRGTGTTGTIIVNGTIDSCPIVTSYTASPLAVAAGGAINVSAMGSDADPGDTVTFAWTATAGTFDGPTLATTMYHCPATSGQQTLTVTLSDGPRKCTTPVTIVVGCGLSSVCGNNVVETGEQCDPPNGTTCSATCQTISGTGGAGTGGAGTGGAGTGGAGTGGAGTGGASTDPSGATLACKACEDTGAGSSTIPPTACVPTQARCDNMTGTNQALCYAAVACMRQNHCAVLGDASFCYCTAASQATLCAAGADGLCAAALEAADTNITAADNTPALRSAKAGADLSDPSLPIGRAINQIGCDAAKCASATTCGGQF